MASRWEVLATVIDQSNFEDNPFKDDLITIMRICHDADTFMDNARSSDALAISMPEVTDMIYDAISDGWSSQNFDPPGDAHTSPEPLSDQLPIGC